MNKSEYTHASIVPLIGGLPIGIEQALDGKLPEVVMSYEPFVANDSHYINYLKQKGWNGEYINLSENPNYKPKKQIDIIGSTCPCAGLSTLSTTASADSAVNDWMETTTRYVLEELKPRVLWGENAPGFYTNIGRKIRAKLRKIGEDNGYKMSVYKTKSLYHGLPQLRARAFYFFWKDIDIPIFEYFKRDYTPIDEYIREAGKSNFQTEPINPKLPSEEPYFKYILEEIHDNITPQEFLKIYAEKLGDAKPEPAMHYITKVMGHTFYDLRDYFEKIGDEREYQRCLRKIAKLEAGGGIMIRGTYFPINYNGAFVSAAPLNTIHPDEDRYISYREAMSLMGLPADFELLNAKRSVNHICQNVPVTTARDMATEVIAALDGNREYQDSSVNYMMQNNLKQQVEVTEGESQTLETFFD